MQEFSEIDKILDEENTENVILYDENQHAVEFQQVAIIPIRGTLYVILKPVRSMAGVNDDEALVFQIEEIDGEDCLVVSDDEAIVDQVFEEYYHLLADEGIVI